MDLWSLVRIIGRHRLVFAVVLAVTVIGGLALAFSRQASYEATGSLLVVGPPSVTGPEGQDIEVNPLAQISQAQVVTAAAIVDIVQDPAHRERLEEGSRRYHVGVESSGQGAIIDVDARASSSDSAVALYDEVQTSLTDELDALQEATGAASDTWLELQPLATPTRGERLIGSQVRVLLASLALGLLLAGAAALIADRVTGARPAPR